MQDSENDYTDLQLKNAEAVEPASSLNGQRALYATDDEAEVPDEDAVESFPANGLPTTILVGVIAGLLSVAFSIGITFLNAPIFQEVANEGKAVTANTYMVAFVIPGLTFLVSMVICFFSGFLVGKRAVRRQLGFLVGVIIGVIIYLGGFITRYIPGYPSNLTSGTAPAADSGATLGAIGLLLVFLMFWSMISGLVSLWGARVATRRHPFYQLPEA